LNPALVRDCDNPQLPTENVVWRDIAVLAIERGEALEECTSRMRAIREAAD